MRLHSNNKYAIKIAHKPMQHDKTKHIEVDRHFIKENLDNGLIWTPYMSAQNELANIVIKGLNYTNFERIVSKMGMENTYLPAWGGVSKPSSSLCILGCVILTIILPFVIVVSCH